MPANINYATYPSKAAAQVPPAVTEFYDKTLLERALPLLVHDKFGQRRPLPKNFGDTIKFRRYEALPANTSALAEGVAGDGKLLDITDITATVAQYGDYIKMTDRVTLLNVENVVTEAVELIGEQAGLSLDTIVRDVLVAGTNVFYSGTASARNAVVATPTTTDFDKIITLLKANNAKKFTQVIQGTDRFNTTPVPASYYAIYHPHLYKTLKGLSGWIPVEKYPKPEVAIEGETGAYDCIRFIETSNAWLSEGAGGSVGSSPTVRYHNVSGTNYADVYAIIVLAKDAYGITEIQGEGLKTIIKPLGSAGTSDPLDMITTVGWKAWIAAKILNDNFLVRLECAAPL